jgi:hypothetical protein
VAFVAASGARAGAGAAGRRAGASRAARKPAAAGSTTTAEAQREAIQALKDARPDPEMKVRPEDDPRHPSNADKAPATVRLERPEAAPAGAGIVLGVLVWAVARSYIEGGVPRVRKLLRAKFLNQTTS